MSQIESLNMFFEHNFIRPEQLGFRNHEDRNQSLHFY